MQDVGHHNLSGMAFLNHTPRSIWRVQVLSSRVSFGAWPGCIRGLLATTHHRAIKSLESSPSRYEVYG